MNSALLPFINSKKKKLWHFSSSAKDVHFGISSQQLKEIVHQGPQLTPLETPSALWSLPPGDTHVERGHLQRPAGPPSHILRPDTPSEHTSTHHGHSSKESSGTKARRHPLKQEREEPPILWCLRLCRELFWRHIEVSLSGVHIYIITRGGWAL